MEEMGGKKRERMEWLVAACLTFLAFQFLSYMAMLQSAFSAGERRKEQALAAGLMAACFLLNVFTTVLLEFTSMAALMATSGYVCLLLNRNTTLPGYSVSGRRFPGSGLWRFMDTAACVQRTDTFWT